MEHNLDSRPVPDPTVLTTQQVQREIAALKELVEMRFNGMDKAIELVQAEHDKFPNRMDEKIAAMTDLHNERFRGIAVQFTERDIHADSSKRDGKMAIDAALQASKEAVSKTEGSTAKQIGSLDDKIDDLKERLTRLEGTDLGRTAARTTGQALGNYVMAIIGTVLTAAAFIVGLLLKR